MKKDILLQRFVYARIIPCKDYCSIDEKTTIEGENSVFQWFNTSNTSNTEIPYISNRVHFHDRDAYSKKNSKIFYASKGSPEKNIRISSKTRHDIYTTEDRHIKKHFGRPFSEISIKLNEKSIREDEDKIYVRKYWHTKSRHINCRYFKRTNGYHGFTFNKKNGNIISYTKSPGQKLSMRQNSFDHLLVVLTEIISVSEYFNEHADVGINTKETINGFKETFSRSEFIKEIYNLFSKTTEIKIDEIPEILFTKRNATSSSLNLYNEVRDRDYASKISDWVMKCFVEKKGIKTPNVYKDMLTNWYPTKPFLAKNDNKLVLSILDRLGIKSKSLNKLIHSKDNFVLEQLLVLMPYFGKTDLVKYVSNLTQNFFDYNWKLVIDNMNSTRGRYSFSTIKNLEIYDLTPNEKKTVLRYINNFFNITLKETLSNQSPNTVSRIFRELNDHFNMIAKVREYYPDTEMRATNQLDFHAEHIALSKIQNSIKKGYTIQYTFPEEFVSYIEEPILTHDDDGNEVLLYPVLLKTDSEYTEEGSHMHHCVGSYADRETSIIISLRVGSKAGDERVTSEFTTDNRFCVQSKYFCNKKPPELFENPLVELIARIHTYEKSIKSIKKEHVPLVINGIVVPKERTTQDFFLEFLDRNEPVQQMQDMPH